MDIYKFSELDSAEDKQRKTEPISETRGLKITDIRQAVKNENRVNIFVNGKYSFSLDISQVVDLGVKRGQELSPERFEELKKASDFGKLYQRTLEWVLTRPHSVRETRDYLRKKIFEKKLDEKYPDVIVERLLDKGYLNDELFARHYIENRFAKKGVSMKRLRMELVKKGVSKEIIEEAMVESERNDEDEIRKIIAKKRSRYDDDKLVQYLCRQGFSYGLVSELVKEDELEV